jgi:hypothetical protein
MVSVFNLSGLGQWSKLKGPGARDIRIPLLTPMEVSGAGSALDALEQCMEELSAALGQTISFMAEGFVGAPDYSTWYAGSFVDDHGVTRSPYDSCLTLTCAVPSTVVIDGCDSGVPNYGGAISALIAECQDGAASHGEFVSCVAELTAELKKHGVLTGKEKGAIQSCAARSSIGKSTN